MNQISNNNSPDYPLIGEYLIRKRWVYWLFHAIDSFLEVFAEKIQPDAPDNPRKILVSNIAHLGDVLISTSVLSILRSTYPDAVIGFVAGKWSLPILSNHPMVDRIHLVDHWFLNRADLGMIGKVRLYLSMKNEAIRQIRKTRYDVVIDLYSYFPNSIPLLWKTGIPVRIGYSSGGFGPLLTHPVPFRATGKHEADYQSDLLRVLGVQEEQLAHLQMVLPSPPFCAGATALRLLEMDSFDQSPYRLIHMGSGAGRTRELPQGTWRGLAERLMSEGHRVVFTGIGERERKNAENVTEGLDGCHNLCDRLNWWDFVELIRHAEIVYSVETSAGHIAAALGTPCVSVYGGISDIARWRPRGEYCTLIISDLDCSPCYRKDGCETMECLRDIPPGKLHSRGEELLALAVSRGHRRRKPVSG